MPWTSQGNIRGSEWLPTFGPPPPDSGRVGDWALDLDDVIEYTIGDTYHKVSDDTWEPRGSIRGPASTVICTRATRPTEPATGQLAYETDTKRTVIWTGAEWAHQAGEIAGVVKEFHGDVLPSGYLWASGYKRTEHRVAQAQYPDLFGVLGHKYGPDSGDGTFALPNHDDVFAVGASAAKALGTTDGDWTKSIAVSNLPSHNHDMTHTHTVILSAYGTHQNRAASGAAGNWWESNIAVSGSSRANTGNTGGGQNLDVTNPYLAVNYIIKF